MTKTKYLEIQSSLDSHINGDDNIKNNDHIEKMVILIVLMITLKMVVSVM